MFDLKELTEKAAPRLDEMHALVWSLVQKSCAHWQQQQTQLKKNILKLAWLRAGVLAAFVAAVTAGISGSLLLGLATLAVVLPLRGVVEKSSSQSAIGRWTWPDRMEIFVCPAHPAGVPHFNGLLYAHNELKPCKLPAQERERTGASVYLMLYRNDKFWGKLRLDNGAIWVNNLGNDNEPWAKAMAKHLLQVMPARVHELHEELLGLLRPALPAPPPASQEKPDPWARLLLHGVLKENLRQQIELLYKAQGCTALAITGGAGSGKSLIAEIVQEDSPVPVYVSNARELTNWCTLRQERQLAEFAMRLFAAEPKIWVIDNYEQGFGTDESQDWLRKLWKSLNEQGTNVGLIVLSRRQHTNWDLFGRVIEIENPDFVARRELLKYFIAQEGAWNDNIALLDHVLELMEGYSAGQLKVVANKATQLALERALTTGNRHVRVSYEDLVEGVSCASIASIGREAGAIRQLAQHR